MLYPIHVPTIQYLKRYKNVQCVVRLDEFCHASVHVGS